MKFFISKLLSKSIVLLIFCFIATSVNGQETVTFYVDSLGVQVDSTDENYLIVPINVVNFNRIAGFTIVLTTTDGQSTIDTFSISRLEELNLPPIGQPEIIDNVFFLGAADFTGNPNLAATLPDSSTLFTLRVELASELEVCSMIELFENRISVGAFDNNDILIEPPVSFQTGSACHPSLVTISGKIYAPNESESELANIVVELSDIDGEIARDTTDENGNYGFIDLENGMTYRIKPLFNFAQQGTNSDRGERITEINVEDVIKIRNFLFGLTQLSSYELIAADLDMTNNVGITDLIGLQYYILFRWPLLPQDVYWRFVNEEIEFTNPDNPFLDAFDEIILTDLSEDTTVNFIGIKLGDINFSSY